MQEIIELNLNQEELDYHYDIEKITKWVTENKYRSIALQFPDELLQHSIKIANRLKEKCELDCTFFILADTSFGNCCVDTVSAEHYNADSIVHFGHSCLSLVDKIPVFYVFEKLPIDLDLIKKEVESIDEKLIILYDVSYHYLNGQLCDRFSANSNIFVSNFSMYESQIDLEGNQKNNTNIKIFFSRCFPQDLKNSQDSYSFFYIGSREAFLNPFLFYFNKNKFHHFDPKDVKRNLETNKNLTRQILFSSTNRELMKRYYLIEKARDSRLFGILVGTMSVSKYKDAIDHVSGILKKANRRYYSFLIGKINCPKLNNFLEIDMYVMVACPENSLINSKELNKPIITVYELELALNCSRLWGEEFVCDYKELLPGSRHHLELKLSEQEADISLISGSARVLSLSNNEEVRNSLMKREDALSVIHYSGAGEFLQSRTWSGLEQNLGETEVTKAKEGRKGIAMGYETEN